MKDLRAKLLTFEGSISREKRKRLGQFFTSDSVSRLLCHLAIQGKVVRLIDPMAGHGSLIEAAANRLRELGSKSELNGIEIDEPTARMCSERVNWCAGHYGHNAGSVVPSSAFAKTTWQPLVERGLFDLVLSNPPYVRYQSSSKSSDEIREGLRAAIQLLAPESERAVWNEIVDEYSGLSDLSVPSWILCSLACSPGGVLGLVVPKTWLSRVYARVLRYVQLRFFEPLFIIEEHGVGWFQDALVPTTLVISKRLSPQEATVPVSRRDNSGRACLRVTVDSVAAGNGISLVGKSFAGDRPEEAFVRWLREPNPAVPGIKTHREASGDEWGRLSENLKHSKWFRRVEGLQSAMALLSSARVPRVIDAAVELPSDVKLVTLADAGVTVGQGLRTGCNQFFYVDVVETDANRVCVATNALFAGCVVDVPPEMLHVVLRRQSEFSGWQLDASTLRGRVLDLRGWQMPSNVPTACGDVLHRTMPESVEGHVRNASLTEVVRGDRRVPIPKLSAVAPNVRQGKNGVGPGRAWYMLPDFAPRHQPIAFVPRVNEESPRFVLNSDDPAIIDANFSTIYALGTFPSRYSLIAVMNSTWCQACVEAAGTPLGGGALKLEATHIRDIPIPVFEPEVFEKLDELGRQLVANGGSSSVALREIDTTVLLALIRSGDTHKVLGRLREVVESLRAQRKRNRGKNG